MHSKVILARTNELPEDDTLCVETCRSSLFVISKIILPDIYVHSLVELKTSEQQFSTSRCREQTPPYLYLMTNTAGKKENCKTRSGTTEKLP